MIPETLLVCEIELRKAVELQRFEEVCPLSARYCRLAVNHIGSLPTGSTSARDIILHVQQVLDWSQLTILAARTAISSRLTPLPLITRYLNPVGASNKFRIEA